MSLSSLSQLALVTSTSLYHNKVYGFGNQTVAEMQNNCGISNSLQFDDDWSVIEVLLPYLLEDTVWFISNQITVVCALLDSFCICNQLHFAWNVFLYIAGSHFCVMLLVAVA